MNFSVDPLLVQDVIQVLGYSLIEVIYTGSKTVVCRALEIDSSHKVVIKYLNHSYPSFEELAQFRNQYTITQNLSIPGIVKPLALEWCDSRYALIMEDTGGISLADYVQQQSLGVADILAIALQLADIFHDLHQQRVIHKDIKPANILIHPDSKQVWLIDFSIASLLPKETQAIQSPKSLEGTLAYLAPEQTGRMNRAIDYRTDFYALGVTLYELLSGQLPFTSNDPLEMIHCHMAQQPTAVNQVNPQVPSMVAAIVAKMMAKNAEDRYQSSLGLKYDLEQCLSKWHNQGDVAEFELGQKDVSDRFLIPEKLYGRETEVMALLDAFNRASAGQAELMLVAGFSGIGKTAVINEIHKPIVRQRGHFIKGKFDQFNRNIPFSAFVQAFRSLVRQLLGEDDAELKIWKAKFLEALGKSAQVLLDLIPELETILGSQPPAPELSGNAAQNRFKLLFGKFVRVFTTKEHPLVIFLDDLQWIDSASLGLLNLLMSESGINPDTGHLLVLGAYRDNEVFPAHPLMLALNEMEKQGTTLNTITLEPLRENHITQLVADTLLYSQKTAKPLSQLVYQKTKGNPFFSTQFLQGLYAEHCIVFDSTEGYWQCDLVQVEQLALTNDVMAFMVDRLRKLPKANQNVLKIAACIGNQFDLATLAIACEQSQEEVATALWRSLQEGLVIPESEAYKFFQGHHQNSASANKSADIITIGYRFLHDRVQQAAYALIDEADKGFTHYQLGRYLLEKLPEAQRDEKIFDIVNHLVIGINQIRNRSEKEELATLALLAGQKAKTATAYDAAIDYFAIAIDLNTDSPWTKNYKLSMALHEQAAEAAYLNGSFTKMDGFIQPILHHAKNSLDRVNAYDVMIQGQIAQNNLPEAIEIAVSTLQKLGVEFPHSPTQAEIQSHLNTFHTAVVKPQLAQLVHESKQMQEEICLAQMKLLASVVSAAYQTASPLLTFVITKQIELSINFGNSPLSAFSYIWYSLIIAAVLGDIDESFKVGQLSLKLLSTLNNQAIKAKVLNMCYSFNQLWKRPVREALKPLVEGYQSGLRTGDLEYASYAVYNHCALSYCAGVELTSLISDMQVYGAAIQQFQQETALNFHRIFWQSATNWMDFTHDPSRLAGEIYDESKMLPIHQSSNDRYSICTLYINKLILAYGFDQYQKAQEYAIIAEEYASAVAGSFKFSLIYFYSLLANLKTCEMAEIQQRIPTQVTLHLEKLEFWANHAPMNHQHKVDLVKAEQHRILQQNAEAIEGYDRAIAGAKANDYIQEEALANELAAKFYLNWGKEKVAAGYMQEAYYCYSRWGARAKIIDLETRYPHLLRPILDKSDASVDLLNTLMTVAPPTVSTYSKGNSRSSTTRINDTFDFASILKASQVLSSAIQLDELLHQLTEIILHNSGGDRCAVILPTAENQWQVRAIATPEETRLYTEPLNNNKNLPGKLIQYVKNTQEVVVIDDLETDLLVIDDYLRHRQPKSILCLPIMNHGCCIGIILLENQWTRGVFTEKRILILNFLCTQAAIAIENARLFAETLKTEASLRKSQEKLRATANSLPGLVYQFRVDLDGNTSFPYLSDRATEILEVERDVLEKSAEAMLRCIDPKDLKAYELAVTHSMKTLTPLVWMGCLTLPSGRLKWIEVRSTPTLQDDGSCLWDGVMLDVSDRKRAEANSRLLASVVESSDDAIITKNLDSIITSWNRAAVDLFGYAEAEAVGQNISILFPPERLHEEPRIIAQLKNKTRIENFETVRLHKDGFSIDISVTISPLLDGDGNVIGGSKIVRDIRDRKKTENALRASESRFRTLLSNLDGAVYRCRNDVDWTMEFMSDAVTKLSGYPVEDFVNNHKRTFASIIHPDDLDITYGIIESVKQNKPYTLEYRIINRDGSVRWVAERGKGLFNDVGQVTHFAGVIVDISDRKAAEQKVLESQTFLQTVLDTFPLAIFWKDCDLRYLGANQNFAHDAGLDKAGDLVGLTDFDMPWAETEAKAYRADDQEVMESDTPKLGIIETQLQADGTQVWLETNKLSLHNLEGNVIGVMGTYQDISDRKRAEEAILQKSQDLQQALTQLENTQLHLVKSEKMSALGNLVAGVAHEINNPVGCIVGNVSVAQDYIDDLLGLIDLYAQEFPEPGETIEAELDAVELDFVRDDLPKLIQSMKDGGDRITSISRSLRTFSRADTETKQSFDIHEGLDSTVLILRHRLKANDQRPAIEVIKEYGPIPSLACFPGQLNQVFMNIFANAIDALDETNQHDSFNALQAAPHRITIRTTADDTQVAIAISDNGPGISEEVKNRIFDHLFTTKAIGKGTGLGLAIAHQIVVDIHGGSLDVHSEVSQGTEFCIRLPL